MSRMPPFYRPPFGGPLRWQDDTSGELPRAVKAFFKHQCVASLSATHLELVRDYCEYYINAPCWFSEHMETEFAQLRARIKTVASADELNAWLHDALGVGIDPF